MQCGGSEGLRSRCDSRVVCFARADQRSLSLGVMRVRARVGAVVRE